MELLTDSHSLGCAASEHQTTQSQMETRGKPNILRTALYCGVCVPCGPKHSVIAEAYRGKKDSRALYP